MVQKVVLGAIVVRDGRVLILQRNKSETVLPGLWELPSGKKEPLEKSEDGLIREVREETGLEVKIKSLVSVFDYQIEKPEEIRDSTQINFLVEPVGSLEPAISEEHESFAWIDRSDLGNYELSDATKAVILSAFKVI